MQEDDDAVAARELANSEDNNSINYDSSDSAHDESTTDLMIPVLGES